MRPVAIRAGLRPSSDDDGALPAERLLGQRDPCARARACACARVRVRVRAREAIDELPPRQANVLVLRDVEGWEPEEVCAALGLSPGNQRILLRRAQGARHGES